MGPVLRFSGTEVRDASGALVASVTRRRGGTSLEVRDAAGVLLGAASTGRWGMSNLWRGEDSAGQPLLELNKHTFRSGARVQLARGLVLQHEPLVDDHVEAVRADRGACVEHRD